MLIETLDGGMIQTGILGPDNSRVRLGEMPIMSTQQFVGYAAMTLAENIIPHINYERRTEWAGHTAQLYSYVRDLPLRQTGQYLGENINDIAQRVRPRSYGPGRDPAPPAEPAHIYQENPFVADATGQRVNFTHEDRTLHVVKSADFFNISYDIITGGIQSWGDDTYQEVKDAAGRIHRALSHDVDMTTSEQIIVKHTHGRLHATVSGERVVIDAVDIHPEYENLDTDRLLMVDVAMRVGKLPGVQIVDAALARPLRARAFVQAFEHVGYDIEYYDGDPEAGGRKLDPEVRRSLLGAGRPPQAPAEFVAEYENRSLHIRARKAQRPQEPRTRFPY